MGSQNHKNTGRSVPGGGCWHWGRDGGGQPWAIPATVGLFPIPNSTRINEICGKNWRMKMEKIQWSQEPPISKVDIGKDHR